MSDAVQASIPRPVGVPAQATWDAESRVWRLEPKDGEGRLHGLQQIYWVDGGLRAQSTRVHGELNGPSFRYHPDGALARQGVYESGHPVGEWTAYAADIPSEEGIHLCCVPPNTSRVVTVYGEGGSYTERFYDMDGVRRQRDGSLYPQHPASVDAEARFVFGEGRWESGRYAGRARDGLWRCWSEAGELIEVAMFRMGQRHGLTELYVQGELDSRCEFEDGAAHGEMWERVPSGTFEDPQVKFHTGAYHRGLISGKHRYFDAAMNLIASVELGRTTAELSPADEVFTLATTGQTHATDRRALLSTRAEQLTQQGELDRAFWLSLRLAALGEATNELRRAPLMTQRATEECVQRVRAQQAPLPQVLANLLAWMRCGARPARLLREMATLLIRYPQAGLQAIGLALQAEPDMVSSQIVHALLLMEAAKPEQAELVLRKAAESDSAAVQSLRLLHRVTFPEFDFWPERMPRQGYTSAELPTDVAQPVHVLRQTIAKVALRIGLLRDALRVQTGRDEPWFPPDLAALQPEPVTLESYSFEVTEPSFDESGSESSDTVVVEEVPQFAGQSVTELMRRARVEWAAVSWLCYCAGLREVAQPAEVRSPSDFGQTITTVFARHYRVLDQLQTSGLRSQRQGIPSFEWESTPLEHLGRNLVEQARDEYAEVRAVLYFAADPSCRSLWQDDLRG